MDLFGDLPEPTASIVYRDEDLSGGPQYQKGEKRKEIGEENAKSTNRLKSSVRFKVKGYVAERQGERDNMQDAHVMMEDFTSQLPSLHPSIVRVALYAIFDGHGGSRASRFASQHLHKYLRDNFPKGEITQVEKDLQKTFVETCKKTDDEFLKMAAKSKPSWKDGTTVTVVLVVNDTLYTANLGDSQVYICRRRNDEDIPIHMTTLHSPSAYEERIRIQKAGGTVREGRVMGVLDVSRSVGDGQYKKHGVTCLPDMKKCQLTEDDKYIIIACDGLWKAFTPEDCIDFTNTILQDTSLQGTDVRFESVVNGLANTAVLRLSSDNVTVLVVTITDTES